VIPARLLRRAGGVLLTLDPLPIPRLLGFQRTQWTAKSEFHVTLIGTATAREKGIEDLAVVRAARGIRFAVALRGEYWILARGSARSIVRMCEVEGAHEFFERLGGALEEPPYHVTLYTSPPGRGIGAATLAELRERGTPLEGEAREELERLLA
jgi:hypothetical protein